MIPWQVRSIIIPKMIKKGSAISAEPLNYLITFHCRRYIAGRDDEKRLCLKDVFHCPDKPQHEHVQGIEGVNDVFELRPLLAIVEEQKNSGNARKDKVFGSDKACGSDAAIDQALEQRDKRACVEACREEYHNDQPADFCVPREIDRRDEKHTENAVIHAYGSVDDIGCDQRQRRPEMLAVLHGKTNDEAEEQRNYNRTALIEVELLPEIP